MEYTDEQQTALRQHESATKRIHACLPSANGGKSAEVAYAEATAHCVRLGIMHPLKKKYRG